MLQGSRRNQAEKSRFVQKRLIDAAQGQSVVHNALSVKQFNGQVNSGAAACSVFVSSRSMRFLSVPKSERDHISNLWSWYKQK